MNNKKEHYCIYLDEGLREVFEKEANKSQLVQSLLRIHYKSKGVNVRTYVRVLK